MLLEKSDIEIQQMTAICVTLTPFAYPLAETRKMEIQQQSYSSGPIIVSEPRIECASRMSISFQDDDISAPIGVGIDERRCVCVDGI